MISIIVIVKNDAGITNTLSGLNNISISDPVEIFVIDKSTIKYTDINYNSRIKWIKYTSSTKKITIAEQRNLGIKKSKGEIIVFIDANCIPDNNWISELIKPIQSEKENIVAGKTLSITEKTQYKRKKSKIKKIYLAEAATINLAISRNVFLSVGLFDENFEYGSDVDFIWRAIDKGYKVRFQPSAIVFHNYGNIKDDLKRNFMYGKARFRLIKKHFRTRWKNLLKNDSPVVIYPLLILGLPLAIKYPLYIIIFILLIIKNIKYTNPFYVVTKHIFYGLGVISEILLNLGRK